MTQEQKDLLLNDICARLPYGVKCQVQEDEYTYIGTLCRIEVDYKNGHLLDFAESISGLDCQVYLSEIKPYLFPLSSMTDEQRDIYGKLWWNTKGVHMAMHAINFLNKHHFDYRGLIKKGLAIDATGLNIY